MFDFEAKNSYSIRVRSIDAGGLHFEKQFTINAINVNEAPFDIALAPSSVDENMSIGTASGSVLLTASVFDYETKSTYLIRVRTTDAGGLFLEKQLAVNVLNVNDHAPVVSDQVLTISEDVSVRTSLGVISATDADGDTLSFVITDGAMGLFEIDAATGELFYNASAPLSYRTMSQYVLSVDVSDGLHTTGAQITVQVVAADNGGTPTPHPVVRHRCSCSGGGEMSFVDSMAFLALVLFRRRASKRTLPPSF